MTKLEAIIEQLPDGQREQVENYAASLLPKGRRNSDIDDGKPNRIQLEKLDGLLVRTSEEMSDEEIAKRTLNAWADAAED